VSSAEPFRQPARPSPFVELVGVYHADGGLMGEARYLVGHLLGTAHCALCDITHSPVRRKPAWDAMTARLGVPIRLVHRNERTPDEAAVSGQGTPCVLARGSDGSLQVLLGPADLELGGSIEAFEAALRSRLSAGVG
jgi:hypothetical protein